MDSFQSGNVRKKVRDEKLSHYVLSIYNTREIPSGDKVSDKVCRAGKQRGYIKKRKKKSTAVTIHH